MPTDNQNFPEPQPGDTDYEDTFAQFFDQIDRAVEIRDTKANRSNYEPKSNAKFRATDTGEIFIGNGTSWVKVPTSGKNPTFQSVQTDEATVGDGSNEKPHLANDRTNAPEELTVQPDSGDKPGSILLVPSGTVSRSHYLLANQNDPNNFGFMEMELNGTTALIDSGAKGTGSSPQRLEFKTFPEYNFKDGPVNFPGNTFNAERVTTHHWLAANFSGGDPDARLDNALAAASEGDVIFLENILYNKSRTSGGSNAITTGVTLKGTNRENGTKVQVEWELAAQGIQVEGMTLSNSGQLNPTANDATIRDCALFGASPEISVAGDRCLIEGVRGGAVTFQSGTSNGLIDSSLGPNVTDNGTNTIGDV